MYQKPEVRLIEPQQEQTTSTEVTSSEAAALLAKYGYRNPEYNEPVQQNTDPNQNLTADEFFAIQQREFEAQRQRELQRMYGPKAATFDSNNIRYSNSEYRDLDVDGQNFGIQVQIVSDMPIDNNRRRF
jgi:glucan-binding YG repeat protein